jgi:endonuclease YncB( thermonuclease family)
MNKGLLKQGLAWHYKQYNKDSELAAIVIEARITKIGLCSLPNPVVTWDFRRK